MATEQDWENYANFSYENIMTWLQKQNQIDQLNIIVTGVREVGQDPKYAHLADSFREESSSLLHSAFTLLSKMSPEEIGDMLKKEHSNE